MDSNKIYICTDCDKPFSSEKRYKNHINKDIPCTLVCRFCGEQTGSERSYNRHIKNCALYKTNDVNQTNNIVANNSNSHNTTTNNNANTTINDIKNNVVMLHPFGLSHEYMYKDGTLFEMVKPIRGTLLNLLRQEKYDIAYLTMFNQIHGNPEYPEYHNIYIKEKGSEKVCLFDGKKFRMEGLTETSDNIYKKLKAEMRWTVKSIDDIEPIEKDQLMWNIRLDAMYSLNTSNLMEKIFYNNKYIVEDTFRKNKVCTNLKYIAMLNNCEVENVLYDNTIPLTLP